MGESPPGGAAAASVADPDDSASADPVMPELVALTATELVEERTETSRTFLQPDGSYESVIYAAPVNFSDEVGRVAADR